MIISNPRFFPNRPGYLHHQHIVFLDGNREVIERGKNPLPYLLGQFPELDEAQAQEIIDWWKTNRNGNHT